MTTLFTGEICKKNLRRVAFLEDLNVVFLAGVVALAAAITPWVLAPAAFLELIAIIVVPGRSWYEKRVDTAQRPKDLPLLALMIAGIFIITIFGFGMHRWFPNLSHSQSWEFGALCWTATFVFYYWYRLDPVGENAFKLAGILLLMLLPSLTGAAGWFLWLDNHTVSSSLHYHFLHVICVAMIGTVLLGTDLLLARHSKKPRQKRQLYESVWVADVPIVAAFVVLICFAALHSRQDCTDSDCPDLLLSGAVTFQLIASNVLFILLQFDVLERVRIRVERTAAVEP